MTPATFWGHKWSQTDHKGHHDLCWQEFFILLFSSSSRILQLESVKTNEINHDIHLVFTLF